MKPSEVLKKALESLGPNGEHWRQGSSFGDSEGNELTDYSIDPQDACSWCASAAIIRFENPGRRHWQRSSAWAALQKVIEDTGYEIPDWNDEDERIFADVKAAFETAIKNCETEGR